MPCSDIPYNLARTSQPRPAPIYTVHQSPCGCLLTMVFDYNFKKLLTTPWTSVIQTQGRSFERGSHGGLRRHACLAAGDGGIPGHDGGDHPKDRGELG